MKNGKLAFKDGTTLNGKCFGALQSTSGEVVFSTGMVGYPESLTDPSYAGQILVMTYPLIGNYGVCDSKYWESEKIQLKGLIVSTYIDTPSHSTSKMTLGDWLISQNIPALEIKDTRFLAKKIRDEGCQLGKIIVDNDISFYDPADCNLSSLVSTKEILTYGEGSKTVVLIDCGVKRRIITRLVESKVRIIRVPYDFDIFSLSEKFDGVLISNGPGDPKQAIPTIQTVKKLLEKRIPTFGICLGNQILALASGGDTYKLKFGHRGQNQPCIEQETKRCYLTTQNHGYAIGIIPQDFYPWFINANDGSNEGIHHKSLPFFSVQFHPESTPGPLDTDWLFDYFIDKL